MRKNMGNSVAPAAVRNNNTNSNNFIYTIAGYGTTGKTPRYLQAVKSKLQVQKSNKETEYR